MGGIDTYRVWEYLLLGLISLVAHQPELQTLYAGLPILQTQNWCPAGDLLAKMREFQGSSEFVSSEFPGFERLFLGFWRTRTLHAANRSQELLVSRKGQFRE